MCMYSIIHSFLIDTMDLWVLVLHSGLVITVTVYFVAQIVLYLASGVPVFCSHALIVF